MAVVMRHTYTIRNLNMPKQIPQKLISLLKEVGETPQTALWDVHGTKVVLHKALEKVSVLLDIRFEDPQVITCDMEKRIAVVLVKGFRVVYDETKKVNSKVFAWSFGEATPYNNKNAYPFAMAEKRAVDRVILKIIGIHGDVYSESEADDFKQKKYPSDKGAY